LVKKAASYFSGDNGPLRFFLITAAIAGLLLVFLTPPFQAPDEPVHFMRAYQISEHNFRVDKVGKTVGGYLPTSVGKTISVTSERPQINFYPNEKYDEQKTFQALHFRTNPDKRTFYDFSSTAYYSPVSYLPQATGVLISRSLGASPLTMMYAGRIANLAMWIVLMGLSIWLLPRKKWALAAVAMLPMALFQAASLSADVMTVGMIGLTLAYILKLVKDNKLLRPKQLALLLVTLIALVLSKQILFIFLPLVLLLPNRLLGSIAALKKILLMVTPLLIFGGWMLVTRDLSILGTAINNQDPPAQIHFIINNPHSFINVLWNTYFFNYGDTVQASLIGNFGWVDTPLSELFVTLGYLSLAFLMLARYDNFRVWLNGRQKLLIGAIALLYWLAVSTALYVYYSPVGFKIIVGLQGRYFLPVAILLIPLLYSNHIRVTKELYRRVAIVAPIMLLVASFITIYVRYFIHNV
jgi:uncharacterized membrane protein